MFPCSDNSFYIQAHKRKFSCFRYAPVGTDKRRHLPISNQREKKISSISVVLVVSSSWSANRDESHTLGVWPLMFQLEPALQFDGCVMDGFWLVRSNMKKNISENGLLLGLYLFLPMTWHPGCLPGFHLLLRAKGTDKEVDWASSVRCPPQRPCYSSLCDFWPLCNDGCLMAQNTTVLWGIP